MDIFFLVVYTSFFRYLFIFFAFGQDALKEYAAWIQRVILQMYFVQVEGIFVSRLIYITSLLYTNHYCCSSPRARLDFPRKSSASSFASKVDPDTKPSSDSSSFSPQSELVADS